MPDDGKISEDRVPALEQVVRGERADRDEGDGHKEQDHASW